MKKIVPTITASNPEEYAFQLARLNFASRIHIDITDGIFAPSRTVNLNQIYWDHGEVLKQIDLHLMIQKPLDWLNQVISLAPDLVVLHAESENATENLPRIADHLHKFGIKFGLAILPDTTVENVAELVKIADHVLIFGGHLGYQGGVADLSQLAKVNQIRAINPTAEIAWDGGANLENIPEILSAGVEVVNVGSAIMKNSDPEKYYQEIMKII
ncbi:MAG: hypothetical protein LBM09_02510 [Candidatus Nomurabacteria bacterium]|jgi:ribulose-phosphate 3-epimerase|nr:hypothetical protein [Candidatus Nomurabacteria bacterium]